MYGSSSSNILILLQRICKVRLLYICFFAKKAEADFPTYQVLAEVVVGNSSVDELPTAPFQEAIDSDSFSTRPRAIRVSSIGIREALNLLDREPERTG